MSTRPALQARAGPAWLPDLAALGCLLTFLYVLFLYQGYTRLFRDSDAGWHLRSGEAILRTGVLPRQDPYSFSRSEAPWMNWEWLADVTSGAVHRAAGPAGVAVLFSAAVAVAVWLWFRLHWQLGTNFLLAAALALPLLGTLNLHWLARPHVFSWILMLWTVAWAESEPSRGRLIWFAAVAALWANVHGSFLFAPLLATVYAAARLVHPFLWRGERRRHARYYAAAAVLAALATLVNPYGWNLHRHVLRYLADGALLAQVGEFQSFNFLTAGAWQILLALGLAAAGTVAALACRRLDHFLLGALLLAGAVRSARGLPLVALVLLPLAGGHLTALWTRASGLAPWLTALREYGERLRNLDRRAAGWLWAPLLLAAMFLSLPLVASRAGFPASEFPVEAAARLEQLAPELFQGQGRLLAPDKFGGYLIYRFEGRLKVFFDGRSDFYGSEFLDQWRRLAQVRPGWTAILERYHFTHALLPNDYSLVEALQGAGWTVVHRDATATLLRGKS